MNFKIKCEQFTVNQKEETIPVTEIKTESQDILCETVAEADDGDNVIEHIEIKAKIEPIFHDAPLIKSIIKVENEGECMEKLLENHMSKSLDVQINTKWFETCRTDLLEEKHTVCDVTPDSKSTCDFYNSTVLEDNKHSSFIKIPDEDLECNRSKNSFIVCTSEHTVETPFTYVISDNSYKFPSHVQVHTNEKPYNSNNCSKSFLHKSTLTRHTHIHTYEKPFTCDLCNKSFCFKSNLSRHKHIHKYGRPFTCDICNRSFSDKSNLNTHTRIHTNEKQFSCNICNKSFFRKSNLTTHTRIHTNEKPFSCDTCNRSFSQQSHLTYHIRTHAKEKPFTCNICNKSFSQKFSLSTHIRIHTNEKPFTCNFCTKPFFQKYKLIKHLSTHLNK